MLVAVAGPALMEDYQIMPVVEEGRSAVECAYEGVVDDVESRLAAPEILLRKNEEAQP